MQRPPLAFVFLAVAAPAGFALAHPPHKPPASEFENADIHVERNATDGDTEVVIFAKGGDDGFAQFSVRAPDGRNIVRTSSHDRSVMGQRELLFESPEPPGDAILSGYPEGVYRFKGVTHRGERFAGNATLSHEMPHGTTILSPPADATVPAGALAIEWSAVPGVQQYLLELENESADPEQALTFNLPPGATRFEVPAALIASGAEYQLAIGTVGANGNIVFVEVTFETQGDST